MRAVAASMVMPEINDISKSNRQLILFDHAVTAKHFGAIQVFDAEGRLTIDASALDPAPEDRSDEEYFSIGVASMMPAATADWCDPVSAADKALYAAKAHGRNRSVLANVPKLTLVA
jgi:GGDEF domain-containing protein